MLLVQDGEKIHISHLYHPVSAYHTTPDSVAELEKQLQEALVKAKATTETQIVDHDGEMCFHVTPAGYIILMIPWKRYKIEPD